MACFASNCPGVEFRQLSWCRVQTAVLVSSATTVSLSSSGNCLSVGFRQLSQYRVQTTVLVSSSGNCPGVEFRQLPQYRVQAIVLVVTQVRQSHTALVSSAGNCPSSHTGTSVSHTSMWKHPAGISQEIYLFLCFQNLYCLWPCRRGFPRKCGHFVLLCLIKKRSVSPFVCF